MRTTRRGLMLAAGGFALAANLGIARHDARAAAQAAKLRIASVKFGSVAWLLETIRAEKLDEKHGLSFDIVETATNQTSPVALYGGSADVVVMDWPWALRQRAMGEGVRFAPFSGALGAVMVPADSPIQSLADLKDKRLGVAGSSTDKSWLLLRAHAKSSVGGDLIDLTRVQYGAAPLLNEQLKDGRLDAILNFWTFTARLEAQGFRTVISMRDVLDALGINPQPALVGFIWKESSEPALLPAIDKFLAAAGEANQRLVDSDAPWERLRPLVKAADDREFEALKAGYRSGVRGSWSDGDMVSAEKIMTILQESGDTELVGHGTRFDPKLFHAHGA